MPHRLAPQITIEPHTAKSNVCDHCHRAGSCPYYRKPARSAAPPAIKAIIRAGETIIDGRRFAWSKGDIIVLPSWVLHEHANLTDTPWFQKVADAALEEGVVGWGTTTKQAAEKASALKAEVGQRIGSLMEEIDSLAARGERVDPILAIAVRARQGVIGAAARRAHQFPVT